MVELGYMKPIKHGDSLLFALTAGILFYCSVLEPYTLRPSYFKFLRNASGGKYDGFERIARYLNSIIV